MIPLRIQIKDFMSHRFSDIDCTSFDSTLIVAKNKNNERESNGVGKSTVYYAIEYALFGQAPTDLLDEIVRDGADKCEVIFDFQIGDETYRILRGRSAKGRSELRFWEGDGNGGWTPISERSMPETSKKIQEKIKISYKAFIYSVRYAQDDISKKDWSGDAKDRQHILKEPLHLSPYTKLEQIGNKKRLEVQKNIDLVNAVVDSLGNPKEDLKLADNDVKLFEEIIVSKNTAIEKYKVIISEKKKALDDLKGTVNSDDASMHDKIAELSSREAVLEKSIFKVRNTVLTNKKAVDDNRELITKAQARVAQLEKEKASAESKYVRTEEEVRKELAKVSNDELYGVQLLAQLKAEYDAANKSIPNGDFCSHCNQPITPEHREKCEKDIMAVLAEKSTAITDTETNLKKCRSKKAKLTEEAKQAASLKTSIFSASKNIENNQAAIEMYSKNESEASARQTAASEEQDKLQHEYEAVKARLEDLKAAAQKSEFTDANKKIIALAEEIKAHEESLSSISEEISNAQAKLGAAQEKVRVSKDNIEKLNEHKEKLNKLYDTLSAMQIAVNAFSHGGIPTFIIHSILDELQLEVNQILQILRPEIGVRFDKDLNIYYTVLGQNRSYKQLSGGQRVYILFSLKMGLAKIIQRKIGVDIRFILLDEVERALDDAGIDAFENIVKKLQKDFKVFIITHNKSLKDKFSHAILVEGNGLEGSTSRAVGTNW